MGNKRIFYACQQVAMKGDGAANYTVIHGVQSGSISTTFQLAQTYSFGFLAPYANDETLPEVEVSLSKVLDGYPLLWHSATVDATSPTLVGRSTSKCLVALGIFSDTSSNASGAPQSEVETSGMFPSSLKYNFTTDGPFTEELTLIGQDKIWAADPNFVQTVNVWGGASTLTYAGQFATDDAPIGLGGVNRKQNMLFAYTSVSGVDSNGMVKDPDATILPPDIFGISSSGTNEIVAGVPTVSIQSIAVSVDLSRSNIDALGIRGPSTRTVNFPVEVTCEIGVVSASGDMVSGTSVGIRNSGSSQCVTGANLTNRTIRIATCEGTRLFLGKKNKLSSVNMSGGDAGGGNVEVSYSFSNFNELTVIHSGDPNALGTSWWGNRVNYLT